MPRRRPTWPIKVCEKMVELVRAGRSPYELAKQVEPTLVTVHNWVKQADLDEGRREEGLTSAEREELNRFSGRTSGYSLKVRSNKSRDLVRPGRPRRGFGIVKANRAECSVSLLCRMLEFSTSGHYVGLNRPASKRAVEDAGLTKSTSAMHCWS